MKPKELDRESLNVKDILGMVFYFVAVIGIVFLINTFLIQQVVVDGQSMRSTLQDENRLFIEKITGRFEDPDRFDIVVFHPIKEEDGSYYIKRVIGMPGETIQIIDGSIWINNEKLDENYGLEPIEEPGRATNLITLGKDEYFLMGDNRNNSSDSRDPDVGSVNRSSILGRAVLRVWPLKSFGTVD